MMTMLQQEQEPILNSIGVEYIYGIYATSSPSTIILGCNHGFQTFHYYLP